jgi:hypothetical protein
MHGIKSPEGRWSVSVCNRSAETAHFHYGNVALHIALDDLPDLGVALQSAADGIEKSEPDNFAPRKEGLVQ